LPGGFFARREGLMVLDPALVDEVRRLWAAGLRNRRAIARRTGVSRCSVGAIVSGRRPEPGLRPRRQPKSIGSPLSGPRARCPQCGVEVVLPCQACRARVQQQQDPDLFRRLTGQPPPPEEDRGLHLTPAEEARYQPIRAEKEAQQAAGCPGRQPSPPRIFRLAGDLGEELEADDAA
jgi:hypothetical protein